MKVIITAFPQGKNIQAIKGVRCATGLGLKESKDAVDAVAAGHPVTLRLTGPDAHASLDEVGVVYRRVEISVSLAEFVDVLGRYRRDLTVGDLVDALTVTADVPAFTGSAS